MDDVHARLVDEGSGELPLLVGHLVAPVAPPVDGGDDDVAPALEGSHPMMERLMPLSRLGRNEWGLPPEVIRLDRPRTVDDVR